MKRLFSFVLTLSVSVVAFAQWQPAGDKIKTRWAADVNPSSVLPEYPRPIMERAEWQNLNGLWDYAIVPQSTACPTSFDGEILVPYPVESSLSGVMKHLGPKNALWYERTFTVPSSWKGKDVLLHFGAVDWKAEVFVNDVKIGVHTGGYTPFSFDITPALVKGENVLKVKVTDPSSEGFQPRGKQSERPWLLWYTTVSGIWQTVWMEPVAKTRINSLKTTPDIDAGTLTVQADVCAGKSVVTQVNVYDEGKLIASGKSMNGLPVELAIADAKLWSPESPFLYDLEVMLVENGKVQDKVKSYAAMRKFSMKEAANHTLRLQLNNKDYFQFGTLDQGYWPDGLYTAPTDEALVYDIIKTKELGYNMIRKHIKVEPARWYTWCDKLGIIVWQDMPSGDENVPLYWREYYDGPEFYRSPEAEANFRKEWKEIIDCLYSYPCIGTWVVFNEGWGQFKTLEMSAWTKAYDPTRLVDQSSGGNHYAEGGDMLDLHNYPEPQMYLFDSKRANVLGEYGGIGYLIEGNSWGNAQPRTPVVSKDKDDATDTYVKFAEILKTLIQRGFTGAVYTQTTDVEDEVNGLMTYDREIVKFDEERITKINKEICDSFKE